ncbi:MAG: serine/threonine-protein kinase, partial [Planctomycetota bacterium]
GEAVLTFHDKRAASLEGQSLSNYRIHNKIGEGAMGTVYKATQVSMDRIVALKVLKEDLTRDRDFLRAFLNEARTAGKLNHPNVVRVHDFGDAGGTYYFSMEYVNGRTIGATLERKGKLAVARALDVTRDVASALQHAHGIGILHRDVKPQNILVDRREQVKLTDLGIARAVHDSSERRKGAIMGTPHYLAPETAQHRKYDERSDIYSLGATLFHMVTGRVPFEGEGSLAVITKHIHEPLPSPRDVEPGVPESVCRLIECMMAKNPALRPGSAKELIRDIDEAKRGIGAAPSAAPSKDKRPKPAPRSESARASSGAKAGARVESKRSPAAAAPPAAAPRRRVVLVSSGSPVLYMLLGALGVAIAAIIVWVSIQKKTPTNPTPNPRRTGDPPTPGRRPSGPMTDAEARDKIGRARQAMAEGSNARADRILQEVIRRTSNRDVKSKAWELRGEIRSGGGSGAASADAEEEAADQLASIKAVIRANPQGKVWGTRQLLRLIQVHRRTSAAVEAARLYRELAGPDIPPEVEQMLKSVGPGQSRPAAPPKKLTPAEALARARATVAEAEDREDYHAARAALLRFIEDHAGSKEMTEAAENLDRLDMRVRRHLASVYGRAKALSQQSKFAEAGTLLAQIISEDPIGKDRGLAEALLEANEAAARKAHERALAQARPYLDRCAFERAAVELRSSAGKLAGTEWEGALRAAAEAAEAAAAAIGRFGKKIAAHKGKPLQLKVD